MPVEYGSTTKKGKRVCYARYGTHGRAYTFKCGDKKARKAAYEKAALQGRAIKWRQHGGAVLKVQTIKKLFNKSTLV